MISRDINCSTCGTEGKLYAHDTVGSTPPDRLFRLLGKDKSTRYLHFQCPSCRADLAVDPFSMLGGGTIVGRGPSRR